MQKIAIRKRLEELQTEKEKCLKLNETLKAEKARLSDAIRAEEAERTQAAAVVTSEGIEGDSDGKAIIHRLMTQKSHESGLNQLKDNVAKLSAAVSETERKLRALQAEEARLNKEALALENLKLLQQAEKHFKSMCSSWKDFVADHAETVRLLGELKAAGADVPTLLKFAGINPETLFGTVANASYTERHGAVELIMELSTKHSVFGNSFYRPDKPQETPGRSFFRKDHAFAGSGFAGRK